MGMIKSTSLNPINGGYVPSIKGHKINGIVLGDPILISTNPITFGWDDSAFSNGIAELIDGELVIEWDSNEFE